MDQRPANSTLVTVLWRRFRARSANGFLFSDGTSKARNPSKLSAVTRPWAVNSASAFSTRDGSKPVRFTISPKNNAPTRDNVSKTRDVSGEYPAAAELGA